MIAMLLLSAFAQNRGNSSMSAAMDAVIEALGASYLAMAWKDAIAFLVLILILIIRPTGLLGERVADKL